MVFFQLQMYGKFYVIPIFLGTFHIWKGGFRSAATSHHAIETIEAAGG